MTYQSRAGYLGSLVLFLIVVGRGGAVWTHDQMLALLLLVGVLMAAWDLPARALHHCRQHTVWLNVDRRWRWRSAFVRFLVNGAAFVSVALLVHSYPYFRAPVWELTRHFYASAALLYAVLGYPVQLLTLRYLGQRCYEFGDYALLTLAGLRAVWRAFLGQGSRRLQHPRVRKMLLIYLVGLFFLTLMIRFFDSQLSGYAASVRWFSSAPGGVSFFDVYEHIFRALYRLLMVMDLGIAVIGYTVVSRWLDNRTKSVDSTVYGWVVALACYPPMNSGFTSKWFGYGSNAAPSVTSEAVLMLLMAAVILLFCVHHWATSALGFRFSNLTNRGIVTIGPYRYVRHPSYASKNVAWWLDNTQVWAYGWWAFALLVWNGIYALRAFTEERHLSRDPAYLAYRQQVPNRIFPRLPRLRLPVWRRYALSRG